MLKGLIPTWLLVSIATTILCSLVAYSLHLAYWQRRRRVDRIICPECGREQIAVAQWFKGDPFPTYVHECEKCKYVITESEWEVCACEEDNHS